MRRLLKMGRAWPLWLGADGGARRFNVGRTVVIGAMTGVGNDELCTTKSPRWTERETMETDTNAAFLLLRNIKRTRKR